MELSWKAIAAAAVLLAVGYLLMRSGGDVSVEEAQRLVREGATLVDVRTRSEFAAGHIEGAVNIPVQELDGRAGELGAREKPLVLYCRSGARSSRAASRLKEQGFTQVHDLGAMSRW